MIRQLLIASILSLCSLVPVLAADAVDIAQDPVTEKRLNQISEELRCLVCQNESLAGSRADLAVDLRREIRSLIKDGKSDAEIMDFMVNRYGDFVRYRPPIKPTTWILWFGPGLLLVLAGFGLWRMVRRQPGVAAQKHELSPEQLARAKALLESESNPS